MNRDLFRNVPSEITSNILSRLSVRAIAISKCVCKPWRRLLSSDYFVDSHLSQSAPALAVLMPEEEGSSNRCSIFEIGDELGDLVPLAVSSLPHYASIQGTVNGLLLLTSESEPDSIYICNPITRDIAELSPPPPPPPPPRGQFDAMYGFGVSRISRHYKAVRITSDSDCHVQTLGTRTWRRVKGYAPFDYPPGFGYNFGAFTNGNLHWLVVLNENYENPRICCFDVETERVSTFSAPKGNLCVLGDCLCVCDHTLDSGIAIWVMKEYGVEKSWTKEYAMSRNPRIERYDYEYELVYPIKVFKNGDILMLWDELFLFYYSNETGTTQVIQGFDARVGNGFINSLLFTPSFVSLSSLGSMENVISC